LTLHKKRFFETNLPPSEYDGREASDVFLIVLLISRSMCYLGVLFEKETNPWSLTDIVLKTENRTRDWPPCTVKNARRRELERPNLIWTEKNFLSFPLTNAVKQSGSEISRSDQRGTKPREVSNS